MTIKLQVIMGTWNEPDEVIGVAPFRDKIIIATRRKVLLLEHDEETQVKIQELARRHCNDLWPNI